MREAEMGDPAGATETAVIVPVPAAEPVVEAHRRALDQAAAWGVPAHVTVIYPFLPPARITEAVLDELLEVVARVAPFECVFSRVDWFGQEVVWLKPDPDEPFRTLTDLVWRKFPDYPPYAGAHPEVTPHLTIGSEPPGTLAELQRAGTDVQAKLPIRCEINKVHLIAGNTSTGSWHTLTEFTLAGA